MRISRLVFVFGCVLFPAFACAQDKLQIVRPSNAQKSTIWNSDVFIDPNLPNKQERQFKFNFKQIGNRVFGDIFYIYPQDNPDESAVYGFSGTIDNPFISFEVVMETSNGIKKDLFYGEVSGDQARFIYKPENLRPAEFVVRREAPTAADTKP